VSQTETQVQTEIKDCIAIFHELAKAANINTGTLQSQTISNYAARESTFLADVPGNYSVQARAAMSGLRSGIAGLIGGGTARAILSPLLRNYAENTTGFAGSTDGPPVETDPIALLSRIYKHFIANSLTVQSRNITFATPSAGSNIGTGAINRLTVDAYGYNIEACHVEAKRAECVSSADTGTPPGEEVFNFRGAVRAIDQIPLLTTSNATGGSGGSFQIPAVSGRNSLLANPSFEQNTGPAAVAGVITFISGNSITGWTVGSNITNFLLDGNTGNYYRTYQGITTPYSVVFKASDSLTQTTDINNIQFNVNTPYYFQIAYNRQIGSASGTLQIQLGNSSTSVAVSAQTGWNILRLTLDRRCWPHNFAASTQSATSASLMPIKIVWTGSGQLYVDEALLVPMTRFDGHWYAIVGGATMFVADNHDSFTWTDTFAAGTNNSWDVGIIQTWLWRAFGCYLPSTTGAPTWADPAV